LGDRVLRAQLLFSLIPMDITCSARAGVHPPVRHRLHRPHFSAPPSCLPGRSAWRSSAWYLALLGAAISGAAGYFGGQLDNIMMRVIEFIR
jgi:hypothetical protein